MIRDAFIAFDDQVTSGAPALTSDAVAPRWGIFDRPAMQVIVDDTLGGTRGTLTLTLLHSGDGQVWVPRSASPEIDAAEITDQTTALYGALAATDYLPNLPFVRAQIELGGAISSAHVRLYVVMRDIAD